MTNFLRMLAGQRIFIHNSDNVTKAVNITVVASYPPGNILPYPQTVNVDVKDVYARLEGKEKLPRPLTTSLNLRTILHGSTSVIIPPTVIPATSAFTTSVNVDVSLVPSAPPGTSRITARRT